MDNRDEQLLEKIDVIRGRIDVSYRDAKEALEKTGGDLVATLVLLEEEREKWTEKLQNKGEEVLVHIKGFLEKSGATKIRLKKEGRTLFEFPAAAGVLGLIGMLVSAELAVLGAMGTVAALLNKCTLEIERQEEDAPVQTEERG